jgi:diaminopimelate epimerase
MKNSFFKGHGLGNEYIVLDPAELTFTLTPRRVAMLCDRERGIGSDGVLTLESSESSDFGMRIWNPDGSEAEISGNGLRIFACYLHATGRTREKSFTVETPGGTVRIETQVDSAGAVYAATVHMGQATFKPEALPCTMDVDELIEQPISVAGEVLIFTGVSVGNPHCVIFEPSNRPWSRDDLLRLGPGLTTHAAFPRGVNVQLARLTGPHSVFILIWERGAGETQASGSSACAAASAAVRLGLVKSPVAVRAPGGTLHIDVSASYDLTMKGPVSEVARGAFSPSFVRELR